MESISVRRDRARDRFDGRSDYYDRGPAKNQDRHFCKVIEKAVPELRVSTPSDPRQWKDFPWLTLVLGSGCVQMSNQSKLKLRGLSKAIEIQVDQLRGAEEAEHDEAFGDDLVGDAINESSVAAQFASLLAGDRIKLDPKLRDLPPVEFSVSPVTARLVLLSALLTNFYFNAQAASSQPLGRPNTDFDDMNEAVLPDASNFVGIDAEMTEVLAKECQWHCYKSRLALATLPPRMTSEVRDAICALLTAIEKGLGGDGDFRMRRKLKQMNLRLLTEVAWFFVTSEIGDYSGWSEILFGLMLRRVPSRVNSTRPHFILLRHLSSIVESLMLPPTENSWNLARDGKSANEFFNAAAITLWKQSEVIAQVGKDGKEAPSGLPSDPPPPPAAAFLTGFDLELEMALLRTAPLGSSYFVVIPVHVFKSSNDDMARPCWIRGEVRKSSDNATFADLRTPINWELITANTDGDELRRGPHVVHLSGAPLIVLPSEPAEKASIVDGLKSVELRGLSPETITIEHAVITDEYLAVRHAEVDLFFQFYGEKDANNRIDRSLPRLLTSSSKERINSKGNNPRFWMVVGVAVGDPAIRYRLVSQLSLGRPAGRRVLSGPSTSTTPDSSKATPAADPSDPFGLESEPPGPTAPSTITDDGDGPIDDEEEGDITGYSGIVINRRITNDEASLLYWIGFDVIRDVASTFTSDLEHYALHLGAGGRKSWPPQDGDCALDDVAVNA